MLERPSLLVEAWTGKGTRATVRDGATGEPLGFITWRRSSWLAAWMPARLEVFETEDASLLCVVNMPWLLRRAWRVEDAEERLIGLVRGNWLQDDAGEFLGHVEDSKLLNQYGLELGSWAATAEGWLLQFQPSLEGNPFARMLLLAAALAHSASPLPDGRGS